MSLTQGKLGLGGRFRLFWLSGHGCVEPRAQAFFVSTALHPKPGHRCGAPALVPLQHNKRLAFASPSKLPACHFQDGKVGNQAIKRILKNGGARRFKMEKLVRNFAAGDKSRNAGYNILLYSVYSFTCTPKDSKIHLKVGHRV